MKESIYDFITIAVIVLWTSIGIVLAVTFESWSIMIATIISLIGIMKAATIIKDKTI